jgi:chromosome segregation ATPase
MSTHLDWNAVIDQLREEFNTLIGQHNGGAISVRRFEQRMEQLQEALGKMQAARETVAQDLIQYRKLRDDWYSQRWQVGEAAEQRRTETRTRIEALRLSVQGVLKEMRRMIERLQGTQPAPDILVHQ